MHNRLKLIKLGLLLILICIVGFTTAQNKVVGYEKNLNQSDTIIAIALVWSLDYTGCQGFRSSALAAYISDHFVCKNQSIDDIVSMFGPYNRKTESRWGCIEIKYFCGTSCENGIVNRKLPYASLDFFFSKENKLIDVTLTFYD